MPGTVVLVYKDAFRGRVKAAWGLTEGSRHSVRRAKTKSDHRQNGRTEKMCHQVPLRGDGNPGLRGGQGSEFRTTGSPSCQPWAHESWHMAIRLKPVAILAGPLGG